MWRHSATHVAGGARHPTMHPDAGPKASRLLSKETLRIAILALATILIWCGVEHRWTAEAWRTPVEYYADRGAVDVLSLFAGIKAAADGYYVPFASKTNPWLGAPFVANWNDYPNNEQIQVFLTGMLADTIGVFAAANVAMLVLYVFAAVSFYFVCRQFRCAWPWAFAGGLVFAFAPYAFGHGQHHLTLSAYWHIPLCLLVCRWAATGGGLQWKSWRFRLAVGVAIVSGMQNIYYAAMFVQLLGLGCVLQFLRGRGRAVVAAITVGTVTVATFLLMNVNTFIYHLKYGPNQVAVSRHYQEIEWTAMKLVDFFMPWQHRIQAFQDFSRQYYGDAYVRGESPPANYFGIVGIVALAWFILRVFRRIMAGRTKPLPLEALFFAWIFVFATVGGINGMIGTTGFVLFRCTARYSIFLLCIVLLFLMRRLSKLTVKSPPLAMGLALLMAALALWDQTPQLKTDADIQATAALVDSDRAFTAEMEKRLPENAMIFQVPVMDYPENGDIALPSYEHFRPYIFSQKLWYSFGNDKGRPQGDWQRQLAGLSLEELIATLEHDKFSAIYVNRRGMRDLGQSMLRDLVKLGQTDIILSPRKDLFCVVLHPDAKPPIPTAPGP